MTELVQIPIGLMSFMNAGSDINQTDNYDLRLLGFGATGAGIGEGIEAAVEHS